MPAAVSLVTGTNIAMQHEIFDSFVEAAARQALRTGDRKLAADAFMALEANRAASLRESRELAPVWKKRLPAAYWETLGRLNQEEARDLRTNSPISPESKRLHLELTEMESAAGGGVSVRLAENFRTRNSLIHFQQGLGESDLLLSFYLGKQESYLWAVTQSSIELHRLPAESEIREDVRAVSGSGLDRPAVRRAIGRRSLSTAVWFTRSGGRGQDLLAAVAGWGAVRPAVRGAGERLRRTASRSMPRNAIPRKRFQGLCS